MERKNYVFRCPTELIEQINDVGSLNDMDCSGVLNTALLLYTDYLAKEGMLPARELLPSALPEGKMTAQLRCRLNVQPMESLPQKTTLHG